MNTYGNSNSLTSPHAGWKEQSLLSGPSGLRRPAGEIDAGIDTLSSALDCQNQVAQAKFEKLAGSFQAKSDVGAGDDAGLAV